MRPATFLAAGIIGCAVISGASGPQDPPLSAADQSPPTLEETRVAMNKWLETQQIISRERKDWQQGKEILVSRLDLVDKEIASLEAKISEANDSVAQTQKKRDELAAENDELEAVGAQLAESVLTMESEVRKLHKAMPRPVQEKLEPLFQRIPEDPSKTNVSVAERFQNVLGILNEINKANNEITVHYEVHNLADGRPSEVQSMYVGLAQGYYVSAKGEAGIGRPTENGWTWEASSAIAGDVLLALEIMQGKHTPAFVPLPVKLQ